MKGRPSLPSYCTSKRPSIQSFLWFTSEVHDLLSCHAVAQTLNFYALLPIHRFVHIKSHYQAALKYTLPFLCVCVCGLVGLVFFLPVAASPSLFVARRQNSANDDARRKPPFHHQTNTHKTFKQAKGPPPNRVIPAERPPARS